MNSVRTIARRLALRLFDLYISSSSRLYHVRVSKQQASPSVIINMNSPWALCK